MSGPDKPLIWLHGEIKTPPFAPQARVEAGVLLCRLQRGEVLSLPHSRPMPTIGPACHELRVSDDRASWRVVYRIDPDAILILSVFKKMTRTTPNRVIETCHVVCAVTIQLQPRRSDGQPEEEAARGFWLEGRYRR